MSNYLKTCPTDSTPWASMKSCSGSRTTTAPLIQRVREDNQFVRDNHLESLRESLTLDYASYILALAMGAGKTILMGSIVATEFAMAMEYPEGPFVQNALIFAPGKTILSSLRELADVPYDKLLPPCVHKPFAASLKLTFTRDGDKQIPIVWGSTFNVIVTNTENPRKAQRARQCPASAFVCGHQGGRANRAGQPCACRTWPRCRTWPCSRTKLTQHLRPKLLGKWRRTRKPASWLFKDDGIKKCAAPSTTWPPRPTSSSSSTPPARRTLKRQPLRDVVVWYGLGEGIRDGVLKELANNIKVFDLGDGEADTLVANVIEDFVRRLGCAPPVGGNPGAPARLALYFPNIETRDELRGAVESALALRGIGTDTILAVDGKTAKPRARQFETVALQPTLPSACCSWSTWALRAGTAPVFATAFAQAGNSNNFVRCKPPHAACARCPAIPCPRVPDRQQQKNRSSQLAETYGTSLKTWVPSSRAGGARNRAAPAPAAAAHQKRVLRYRHQVGDPRRTRAAALHRAHRCGGPAGITVETLTPVQTRIGQHHAAKVDGGVTSPPRRPSWTPTPQPPSWLPPPPPTAEVLAPAPFTVRADVPNYHLDALGLQSRRSGRSTKPTSKKSTWPLPW